MKTLPRREPQGAAWNGYEGPPADGVVFHHVEHGQPALAPSPVPQPSAPARTATPPEVVREMVAANG